MFASQSFQQEIRDCFRLITEQLTSLHQKVDDMTTSNQDVMNAIAALPISDQKAALAKLSTDVTTAISDMGTGGDTARAAMVNALQVAATQMAAVTIQANQIDAELVAAIAAATSPPATPPAA